MTRKDVLNRSPARWSGLCGYCGGFYSASASVSRTHATTWMHRACFLTWRGIPVPGVLGTTGAATTGAA